MMLLMFIYLGDNRSEAGFVRHQQLDGVFQHKQI